MKLSVITPCYNSEKTIERTLKSVLNQSYPEYEYIIIDGGSTDRTLEIIHSYLDDFAGKIKVISEPDDGIYDAMNKGISHATGDYIGIVNSDDFYETDCLSVVAEKLQEEQGKYQILYGGMRRIDENGEIESEVFFHHNHLRQRMINHPASFVSKALYEDFGVYDQQYRSAADYDFMLKMSSTSEVKFVPIYRVLTNFSLGGMSGSYVGDVETIKIKYKYGIYSKKRYLIDRCKIWLKRKLNGK